MDRLDNLVVQHLEYRLLDPERLPELLAGLIDRHRMQAAKPDARLADLRKVVAEADAKLTRLYAAIESGVADPTDPNLKGRLTELKQIRDSAKADVERAEAREPGRDLAVTSDTLRRFATEARKRLRKGRAVSDVTTSRRWFSAWRLQTTKCAFAANPAASSEPSPLRV